MPVCKPATRGSVSYQGRYADARRWAERGLTEAEAAHELKAQAKAHAVLHARRGGVRRT